MLLIQTSVFCERHGPSVLMVTHLQPSIEEEPTSSLDIPKVKGGPPSSPRKAGCGGCQSLVDGQILTTLSTIDEEVAFVSKAKPDNEIYSVVRQACVRGLSCDSPGLQGPVLFGPICGNDQTSYVVSFMFRLHDAAARGARRWYSIMLLSSNHMELVSGWNVFASRIQAVVDEMQEIAEQQHDQRSSPSPLPRSVARMHARVFHARRGGDISSLGELLGIKDIFRLLHQRFAWILQSLCFASSPAPLPRSLCPALNTWIPKEPPIQPFITNLHHVRKLMGPLALHIAIYTVIIGNQCIVRVPSGQDNLVLQIIQQLTRLLPDQLVHVMCPASEYRGAWEYNFLGLVGNTCVPGDVDIRSYSMFDVVPLGTKDGGIAAWSKSAVTNMEEDTLVLQYHEAEEVPGVETALANCYHGQEWDVQYSGCAMHTTLGSLYEKIVEEDQAREEEKAALTQVLHEWITKASVFAAFRRMPEAEEVDRQHKLLEVLNLRHGDVAIVRYLASTR